ncbi:CWF19-like protein 2 homolog [Scaptodrosophila lebanonensis]|uniref:CWF19-like protein 2 homolog n=1 Tax=Drosophila lebanonensis TaxID=7225 RepID=A0A6J2TRJ6_DROLE|nr:CWF19-like protein 2 homolog [Scaptodrosophila lebanonensis]
MSYIKFESAREKEKARQQLKEARAELLKEAQERAEQRQQRELRNELRGESNWMLPAMTKKLDKLSNASSKSKQRKAKRKSKSHSIKSGAVKKKRKKRKSSSSDTDSSSSSSSDSSSEEEKKRKRHKKKSKKSRKTKSDSESDSGSEGEEEWIEKPSGAAKELESSSGTAGLLQRDSWMTSETLALKTFTRERKEPTKPNERQQKIDAYDPARSKHELNPYWKSNGTGLPEFQKPKVDDDAADDRLAHRATHRVEGKRNWQKTSKDCVNKKPESPPTKSPRHYSSSNDSASGSSSDEKSSPSESKEDDQEGPKCLNDQQINELAARAIKAELKGKDELAANLNQQLENARKVRAALLAAGKPISKRSSAPSKPSTDHVLLTQTDQRGNVRPLMQSRSEARHGEYGGRKGEKHGGKTKKKVETHEDGQRVRYFADDDRYDIKQMFEREKHSSAADSNMQFADILSKHKNPNDDLEDIFVDKVRKNISEEKADKREMQQAIRDHEKLTATLENCEHCFDSKKLNKQLLVSMGQKIYLTLPWHVGLQPGHCILTTMQHVSCCTQLDEDAWEELNNFRKALTRMFATQNKDVIFYEIANKLHKRPHLTLHCIPIPEAQAEMAPFYFKKAIEESEQEWCINKQLVSLRKKSVRSAIPKGLPYLWVNFGMDSGFAHVIEDEDRFPSNFAQEIIGGMLELSPNTWRKPSKEKNSIGKVKAFAECWKKYDCTES